VNTRTTVVVPGAMLLTRAGWERESASARMKSGTRPASANAARQAGSARASEVTQRRVTTGNDHDGFAVAASAIAPDGRRISLIDWSTFDLAVRDLQTGELHHLTDVQLQPRPGRIAFRAAEVRQEVWAMEGLGGEEKEDRR
jgi:hypothetical protein